jgi:glycine/D-amino acid oxidase-like deaminating enzyme
VGLVSSDARAVAPIDKSVQPAVTYPRPMRPSHADAAGVRRSADVIVIGGGIVGCAAAAMMADRGAHVILVERTGIGAGASGRNLGALQHPFDSILGPLYHESLERYRALADGSDGIFVVAAMPAGLLLLHRDTDAAAAQLERLRERVPELEPQLVTPDDLAILEPALAPGPAAIRLATGYPIPPASATEAWADLAERRRAELLVGSAARPDVSGGRVVGVTLDDGTRLSARAVLVAAGPWTPPLVDPGGEWRPIRPTYGVTLQLRLGSGAPRHIVEEDEVDAINRAEAAAARAGEPADAVADDPPSLFSIATAGGLSTLGSTFLPDEPDPAAIESLLLRRAASFLPGITEAEIVGRRMCARPQSMDGRPFIGAVDGTDGLFVCAGHGPWGISTGPATAAIAARAVLDGTLPPKELAVSRPL